MDTFTQPAPYASRWRSYSRWRLAFWVLFLGFLPAMAWLWKLLAGSGLAALGGVATAAWMAGFLVAGYRTSNLACPRCKELYFRRFDPRPWVRDWQYRPWARQCMHCGLPKWALQDDGVMLMRR